MNQQNIVSLQYIEIISALEGGQDRTEQANLNQRKLNKLKKVDQYLKRRKYEDLNILDCLFGNKELRKPPIVSLLNKALRFRGSNKSHDKKSKIIEAASEFTNLDSLPHSVIAEIESNFLNLSSD